MQPFDTLLLALAIWFTAYMIVKLSGPFNIFGRLRQWAGAGNDVVAPGSIGEMLECIYCTGFWCAVIWLLIWFTPARVVVYPFALAGGALMLHRYTGGMMT